MWGLAAYAVFAIVRALVRHEAGKALRIFCFFVLACFVGLGIGFIQLYPSFMYVRDAFSVRGVDRGFDYATSGRSTGPSSSRSGFRSSATRSTTTGEATSSS